MTHYDNEREQHDLWKDAPEGATHYGGGKYWRMHDSGNHWETECAYQWVYTSDYPMGFSDCCARPQPTTKHPEKAQEALKHNDPVNHSSHYEIAPQVEAIDIIEASLTPEQFKGHLLGNFLKYRLRAGDKDDLHQDIAKSNWYRERLNR